MTGDEIHATGLAQVAELHAPARHLASRRQGYTQGTVGDRINALNREERFLYPNTDEGRAELLAILND